MVKEGSGKVCFVIPARFIQSRVIGAGICGDATEHTGYLPMLRNDVGQKEAISGIPYQTITLRISVLDSDACSRPTSF
jgi:hypothetical protein